MKGNKFYIAFFTSAFLISSCGSGGNTQNGGGSNGYKTPPIFYLPNFPSSINNTPYPTNIKPYTLIKKIQKLPTIPYGSSSSSLAIDLSSMVLISISPSMNGLCSATPIYYNNTNNTTLLITAAHCLLSAKSSKNYVATTDLESTSNISVCSGVHGDSCTTTKAMFVRPDYCLGSVFSGIGECPNIIYNSSTPNLQNNDVAVIQINGKLLNTDNSKYPKIVTASNYPQPNTMAPILMLGYGNSTNSGQSESLYYVTGYYYNNNNNPGYYYIENSYYSNTLGGYLQLICPGDSGGGDLFWNGNNWILLSLHSYGIINGCGQLFNFLPTGSTNISYYYSWLYNIIYSNDPVSTCKQEIDCITNG